MKLNLFILFLVICLGFTDFIVYRDYVGILAYSNSLKQTEQMINNLDLAPWKPVEPIGLQMPQLQTHIGQIGTAARIKCWHLADGGCIK